MILAACLQKCAGHDRIRPRYGSFWFKRDRLGAYHSVFRSDAAG
jgi:hypothetical protein